MNIKSEKSACGAPLQKLELFRCTLKESMSYLNVIEQSKEVLIKFLKKKIEFITSGVEVSYVKEKKDQIEIMLNRIAMASSISLKDKARLDLVKKIVSEYEMYLNLSINYEKNLTASSSTGKLRKKLKNVGNIDYEIATATKIHYELKALALRYTFILTYRIMKDLYNRMGVVVDYGENIEKEMEVAFKLIDENIKKQANVNISIEKAGLIKKFGSKLPITLSTNSKSGFLSGNDAKRIRILIMSGTSSNVSNIFSTSSESTANGKKNLSRNKKDLVEKDSFWKDLRAALGGKTIYIGVIRYKTKNVFKSTNFYILDVINSMIQKKFIRSHPMESTNKSIRRFLIDHVVNNGYLLITDHTDKKGEKTNWRAMNFKELENISNKKRLSYIRQIFFNILSNNVEFKEYMQSRIPGNSKIALNLEKLCNLAGDEKLKDCKFVFSPFLSVWSVINKYPLFTT